MQDWYPKKLVVGNQGTAGTYEFMKTAFGRDQTFCYSEFGIYMADTARNVCELFPNCELHLFDFNDALQRAATKLGAYPNKISYFGNTQKFNDSYNWSLMKLIKQYEGVPIYDYCFLDGAHTVAIDALNFFLCDRLLKVGGYMDFDDYEWRLRGSSLDPAKIPVISDQYTDEQIDAFQVKMIVDDLVRRDHRYQEVVRNKIFQKIAA
ncbi:hypothetical protein [Bradyrhizobium brasilense]|uniref:Class I SAM-dependent methyltransferase n=1 Tax=Bradyrhizobium brasilense TaxID=1419277 RepID=A0A1G7FXQ8_9BRAD|nr:hypothetical protein [Bradyrhizobium brasilense]MCC8976305.1 hypothetical protein [Bradyrhizobium brasilense]SDE80592.1 hypothetical protein SAMN05216337_103579 [Bradyrhizobium brasilense]